MAFKAELSDFRATTPPKGDLVFTDPPYNIGHDYGPVSDSLSDEEYEELVVDLGVWAYTRTKPDAHLVVVHYPEFFFRHGRLLTGTGWRYHQQIRWCYPSNIGHGSKFTRSSRELLWLTKGKPKANPKADPEAYRNPTDRRVRSLIESGSPGRAPYDWWVFNLQKNVGAAHVGYSNQLPEPLIRRVVLSLSVEGQTVLDPFAGTGSTLKVACSLGRKAWGCDANPSAPVFRGA